MTRKIAKLKPLSPEKSLNRPPIVICVLVILVCLFILAIVIIAIITDKNTRSGNTGADKEQISSSDTDANPEKDDNDTVIVDSIEDNEPKICPLSNNPVNCILENPSDKTTYKVTKVTDGDTIWINYNGTNTKIRLIGVNTPEVYNVSTPECYGEEASNYLKQILTGKSVSIEYDSSQGQYDIYGRSLTYIYLNDQNINLKLIQQGYAYEYTYRTPYKYSTYFKAAESAAKKEKSGLWGKCY